MRRFTAALHEGEITAYEFTLLAWLDAMGGAWHGKLTELHAALQWPHSPSHLSKLLRGLREAGLIGYTGRERSRSPFDLALAVPPAAVAAVANPHEHTDCGPQGHHPGRTTPTWQVMSHEGYEVEEFQRHDVQLPTGTYPLCGHCGQELRSSVVGASGQEVESPETGAPSREAPEVGPAPDWASSLAEELDAELDNGAEPEPVSEATARFGPYVPTPSNAWRPPTSDTVLERFQPFNADERTGEAPGDDEAAQTWMANANPIKTRARRRREGGER